MMEPEDPQQQSTPSLGEMRYQIPGHRRLRRIARLLALAPIISFPVVFVAIEQLIPDLNRNSIGDGFRKLNALAGVTTPVAIGCWSIAFAITVFLEFRYTPVTRLRYWGMVSLLLVLLAMICLYLEG